MTTEPATAMPNSLKSRPVEPLRNASGVKTATSEIVVAMTAKAISAGAVLRRGLRVFLQLLLVPVRVLQHDDGVVHHDADGQREREQGEVVDREPEEVHDREGRDDRRGDREAGDDRRPQVPQEEEDDHHDQAGREDQRLFGLLDGALDEDGLVERGRELHARRERRLDPRQLCADGVGHLDDVRLGLPDHADRDGRCAVESEGAALVLGGRARPGRDPSA